MLSIKARSSGRRVKEEYNARHKRQAKRNEKTECKSELCGINQTVNHILQEHTCSSVNYLCQEQYHDQSSYNGLASLESSISCNIISATLIL